MYVQLHLYFIYGSKKQNNERDSVVCLSWGVETLANKKKSTEKPLSKY